MADKPRKASDVAAGTPAPDPNQGQEAALGKRARAEALRRAGVMIGAGSPGLAGSIEASLKRRLAKDKP